MSEPPKVYKVSSPGLSIASGVIIIAGIVLAQGLIIQLLLALFVSIICAHPIFWLEKKKVPHILAIIMVLTGVVIIFTVLGTILAKSLAQFSVNIPTYKANLNKILVSFNDTLSHRGIAIGSGQLIDKIDAGKIWSFTANLLTSVGGIMSKSLLILLITIFILTETFSIALKVAVLRRDYGRSFQYFNEIGAHIRQYLSLKAFVSLITGGAIALWLTILGVDYPILWGLIAFLFNFIPNIGSILAAFPTMLLALVQLGGGGMLWTGIGYLAINLVMGNFIEPRLMGKGLGLSTLVVFLSLIVWGTILGTAGMFLSVPITMTIKIILEKNENTKWIALLLGSEENTKESYLNKKTE